MFGCRAGAAIYGLLFLSCANAAQTASENIIVHHPITSPHYSVLFSGATLSTLQKTPIEAIAVLRVNQGRLESIPFQIDLRDRDGIYQIPTTEKERRRELRSTMDDNDEMVVMVSDLGDRLEDVSVEFDYESIIEIEIVDTGGLLRRWIYVVSGAAPAIPASTRDYVSYDASSDTVEASTYRIGFSEQLPFLANSLRPRPDKESEFGSSILQSMRINHSGKFLHKFPFQRTEKDYRSRLTAIKDGPVRVIRRTENSVHIILGIGSPTVLVDYIHYAAGFVTDIIVDFPFKIGFFFSDVSTSAVFALSDENVMGPASVYSESAQEGLAFDGKMTEREQRFNALHDSSLLLKGDFGQVVADIAMERGSPIEVQVHMVDDAAEPHSATNRDDYHKVLGFYMTKWEKLDARTHHILFRTYLLHQSTPTEGLAFLRNAPSLLR